MNHLISGTGVNVEEVGVSNYISSYTITGSTLQASNAANTGVNQNLSLNSIETIDGTETVRISFINTYSSITYSYLVVTKEVGYIIDGFFSNVYSFSEQLYNFNITLTDASNQALSGSYTIETITNPGVDDTEGTLTLTNGVGTLSLHGNETVILNNIPVGYHYNISETAQSSAGFTVSVVDGNYDSRNQTGEITSGTYEPISHDDTGSIFDDDTGVVSNPNPEKYITFQNGIVVSCVTITKTAAEELGDSTDYDFTLHVNNVSISGNYDVYGNYFYNNGINSIELSSTNSNDITFSLKADEMVQLMLPVGATYSVTEASGDYVSSYSIIDDYGGSTIVKTNDSNVVGNTSLTTATETVDEGEAIVITFRNDVVTTPPFTPYVLPAAGLEDKRYLMFILMFGALIGAMGYYHISKKKWHN